MIRRPPRSTLDRSSAASDVYKRQVEHPKYKIVASYRSIEIRDYGAMIVAEVEVAGEPVSYTHLRAHETVLDLVCRLLLEKKKK